MASCSAGLDTAVTGGVQVALFLVSIAYTTNSVPVGHKVCLWLA